MKPLKTYWGKLPSQLVNVYVGVAVGAIVLVSVSICLFVPGAYLDGVLKSRISRALEEEYPAYSIQIAGLHYKILKNRLECDSVALMKIDSTFLCSVARFSVSGVGRIQLLWGGGVAPDNLVSSDVAADDIVLTFPRSQYELRCERLRVSVPDSAIVVDGLELHPLRDDEQFFAGSKMRKTRFQLVIPHASVMGSACLGMMAGKIHCARSAQIDNGYLNVLINKDKPVVSDSSRPPSVMLLSIKETMQIDSLTITNGRLTYGERFAVGSAPAVISFDSMNASAQWIVAGPGGGDTAVLRAKGIIMNTGAIDVRMSIPIASPDFSFRYSGHLKEISLNEFNPFIEISEHKRLKTGLLHGAAFDIDVAAGSANGTVSADYKDLKIVAIADRTGSESGIANTIISFVGNNMKLRTTNMPDASGTMKIGKVKYLRKRDEAFLAFAWIALRSGLSDIVGF